MLGCTHYPFLRPAIEAVVGPDVQVIDPAPAVARQVRRLWERLDRTTLGIRQSPRFFTTGDMVRLRQQLRQLLGKEVAGEADVHAVSLA